MTEASSVFGFNRSSVVTVAAGAAVSFIGYCIYFDYKRRSAPDYKDKIRQKRREKARLAASGGAPSGGPAMGMSGPPDPADASAMQGFFLQEVQLGEELMASGNIEEGAIHIANAVALCGQSQQLLSIFQQTLPPDQFAAVIEKLPGTRERLSSMFGAFGDAAESEGPAMSYVGDGGPPPQIQELMDDTDDLE